MFLKSSFLNEVDVVTIATKYFSYINLKFVKGKKYNTSGDTCRLSYLGRQKCRNKMDVSDRVVF